MEEKNCITLEVYSMSDMINLFKLTSQLCSGDEQVLCIQNLTDDIVVEMHWIEQKYDWMMEDEWMCPVVQLIYLYHTFRGDDTCCEFKSNTGGSFSDSDIEKISAEIQSFCEE